MGITWTSELLTVTGVDPAGPVSVQPNPRSAGATAPPERRPPAPRPSDHVAGGAPHPAEWPATPPITFEDLKGAHVQAAKLTEWLKLALDEPELLETLGATANLGVLVSGRPASARRRWCGRSAPERRLVELDGPEVGALRAQDRLQSVARGGDGA